jgi:hypothetical protein
MPAPTAFPAPVMMATFPSSLNCFQRRRVPFSRVVPV